MRAVWSFAAFCIALTACSDDTAKIGANWGCGAIAGADRLASVSPSFLLIGESTETSEAPALVAELACRLARADRTVFVGYLDYVGGPTEAEMRMRERLEDLARMGAPIVSASVGGAREWTVRERSAAERRWAETIMAQVEAAGAERALILLPRADATAARISAKGERFAGYDPMPMHLAAGEVLSLEIAATPSGTGEARVRLYETQQGGFHGEIVLASMTRSAAMPELAQTTPTEILVDRNPATDVLRADLERTLDLRTGFADLLSDPDAPVDRITEILAALDAQTQRLEDEISRIESAR